MNKHRFRILSGIFLIQAMFLFTSCSVEESQTEETTVTSADTSSGDTSSGDTSSGDTSSGDTSSGDTSSGDPGDGTIPLSNRIINELETSLKTSTSSSINGKTEQVVQQRVFSTSLTLAQIQSIIQAAGDAVKNAGKEQSTEIADLLPPIIQGSQSGLSSIGLASKGETIGVIRVIVWSLMKSTRTRTESASGESSTGKNGLENVMKVLTESSFSHLDKSGLGSFDFDNASSELIGIIVGSLDETDLTLPELNGVLTRINAAAIGSLGNVSGIDNESLAGTVMKIIENSIGALNEIKMIDYSLDNIIMALEGIVAGAVSSLGEIQVSGYSSESLGIMVHNVSFTAIGSLDHINMSGFDVQKLASAVRAISGSATSSLGEITMDNYTATDLAPMLENITTGSTSALDEISSGSSSSRFPDAVSEYGSDHLGILVAEITAGATESLGSISLVGFSTDNLSELVGRVAAGAIAALDEIKMEGYSADNLSTMVEKISEGAVSSIDEISMSNYDSSSYSSLVRGIASGTTEALGKISMTGFESSNVPMLVKKIVSGATKGLENVGFSGGSATLKKMVNQIVAGSIEASSNIGISGLSPSELENSIKSGANDAISDLSAKGLDTSGIDVNAFDLTRPRVKDLNPSDGKKGISENNVITVTFSESMDNSTLNLLTFSVQAGDEPVQGSVNYNSFTKTVTFTPSNTLASGTLHKASLKPSGITDEAGNPLKILFNSNWSFSTTDSIAPSVLITEPEDNATNIGLDTEIDVAFSESMDIQTITTITTGTACTESFQVSSDKFKTCVPMNTPFVSSSNDQKFSLKPGSSLSENTLYQIRITQGVKDLSGNALNSQYTSTGFSTGTAISTATVSSGSSNSSKCSLQKSLSDNGSAISFRKNFEVRELAVKQTRDCGYIVGGGNLSLIKLDKYGEIEWETDGKSGSIKIGVNTAVIQTSDSGYVVSTQNGMLKVDSDGKKIWENNNVYKKAMKWPSFMDVIETSDGDLVTVTSGVTDFGYASLIKLNKDGQKKWIKVFNKDSNGKTICKFSELYSVIETEDKGFIMVGGKVHGNGRLKSGYKKGCSFEWFDDFWIIKTDSKGNIEWERTYGGNLWDQAYDIAKIRLNGWWKNKYGQIGYALIGHTCTKSGKCYKSTKARYMLINEDGSKILKQEDKGIKGYARGYSITHTEKPMGYAWIGEGSLIYGFEKDNNPKRGKGYLEEWNPGGYTFRAFLNNSKRFGGSGHIERGYNIELTADNGLIMSFLDGSLIKTTSSVRVNF